MGWTSRSSKKAIIETLDGSIQGAMGESLRISRHRIAGGAVPTRIGRMTLPTHGERVPLRVQTCEVLRWILAWSCRTGKTA